MSAVNSKVLYFTAGEIPTAVETAAINRLATVFRNVQVRNGSNLADTKFGDNFESFDFLAGTTIPSAYSSIEGATVIAVPSAVAADQFKVFPATLSIDASDVDVSQLAAVKAVVDPATGLATMTDLAAEDEVVWSTSNGSIATVGGDGLVTAVGAGSATITATRTAEAAVTGGAIEADDDIYTKAAHGFLTGQAVKLVSLTNGTGLTAGTTYYFHKLSADTGYLCSTYANAVAGVPVNVTADGTSVVLSKAPEVSTCAVTVAA